MALVGEEFPEEVSGEGMSTAPPRAPSWVGQLCPQCPHGDGGVWGLFTAPGTVTVTATGLVQLRSHGARAEVFSTVYALIPTLEPILTCSSLCSEEGVGPSQGHSCCFWGPQHSRAGTTTEPLGRPGPIPCPLHPLEMGLVL